jgi:aspartokinase
VIQIRTRRHVCCVSLVEKNLAPSPEQCKADILGRLATDRIEVSMVAVNDVGCAFAIDEYDLDGLRKAVQLCNVAMRVRTRCARVTLVPRRSDAAAPSVSSVIAAMAEAGVGVIHLAWDTGGLSALVEERDAVRTAAVLANCAVPGFRHVA